MYPRHLNRHTVTFDFLIENAYLNCPKLTDQPNFVYVPLQLPKRSPLLARMLLHFSVRYSFLCTNTILLAEMQIYIIPIGRIQLLGKLNLITLNEYFGVLPTGTSYPMNYVLKFVQVSGFIKKGRAAKLLSTRQLMDVLSRLILLNTLIALILFRCFF